MGVGGGYLFGITGVAAGLLTAGLTCLFAPTVLGLIRKVDSPIPVPELNDLTVAHGESETYLHSIDEVCHELPIPLGCSDAGVSSHGDDWKQAVSYPDGLSATTGRGGKWRFRCRQVEIRSKPGTGACCCRRRVSRRVQETELIVFCRCLCSQIGDPADVVTGSAQGATQAGRLI